MAEMKTIFGIPVVVTDQVAPGEIVFGESYFKAAPVKSESEEVMRVEVEQRIKVLGRITGLDLKSE